MAIHAETCCSKHQTTENIKLWWRVYLSSVCVTKDMHNKVLKKMHQPLVAYSRSTPSCSGNKVFWFEHKCLKHFINTHHQWHFTYAWNQTAVLQWKAILIFFIPSLTVLMAPINHKHQGSYHINFVSPKI